MTVVLPAFQVVTYARDFLKASEAIVDRAKQGETDLYLPAVMTSALACEQYLKSFLVKAEPSKPGFLKLVPGLASDKHDLFALYQKIPADLRAELHRVSDQVEQGFPLVERIKSGSQIFKRARYGYEANALQILRSEDLELAPHLDKVLMEMTTI
ncbi:hypothetical protein [Pseudomonas sp. URMO17WK12:I11]|uniref:hypothetical protein n=1 Tax=Pseudomonas sp. URMO17WK12:I11 TaxID=1283291 RepID=UPI0011AB0FDA|nr:hypothetical protein [Pseudomonas sp. URMO17WK12:I11]